MDTNATPDTVRDKIRAWREKRLAEEGRALSVITESICDSVEQDLRHYIGWRYSPVVADDADKLLELAFTLEDLATACRVMARGAEYEWKRNIEKANAKA